MNISIQILLSKDLISEDLEIIQNRIKFDEPEKYAADRIFFLIKDDEAVASKAIASSNLVSFGSLRPVKVLVEDQEMEIMGIKGITSLIERKGYGKILLQEMKKYADEHGSILIGFCTRDNEPFYLKSGIEVFRDKMKNFVYITENGEEHRDEGDVIYYSPKNDVIKKALEEDRVIKHFVPHW